MYVIIVIHYNVIWSEKKQLKSQTKDLMLDLSEQYGGEGFSLRV